MSLEKWYSYMIPSSSTDPFDFKEVEETFKLLKEGDAKIQLDPKHTNPIFVFGNTGSGKSTLIQFMAGDNLNLRSKKVGKGEYIIEDDNEKIGGGITSKTDYPDLILVHRTSAAFYDCPGFNDTRSSSHELATSYFIKKVFDFTDQLKILLTVNHSSVRSGVDRSDFMTLLRHSTQMLKNLDRYRDSIAIFVTKVENQWVEDPDDETRASMIPDEDVVDNIANFLQETKAGIKEKMETVKEKEMTFLKDAIKLIDICLTRGTTGKYSRIGIFRRPNKEGPICDVKLLQDRKPQMRQIPYQTLKFTKKTNADFGYTISDKAKLDATKMVMMIHVNISLEIESVVDALKRQYDEAAYYANEYLQVLDKNGTPAIDETRARQLSTTQRTYFDAITKLGPQVVNAKTITEISDAIQRCSSSMKVNLEPQVNNIQRQGRYFEFLQNVYSDQSIGDYSKTFDGILENISSNQREFIKDTEAMAQIAFEGVKSNVNKLIKALKRYFDSKYRSLAIEDLVVVPANDHKTVINFTNKIKTITSAQLLSNEVINMASKAGIDSAEINSLSTYIFNYGNNLTILNIFKPEIAVWSSDWIKPFDISIHHLFICDKWYNFLKRLYTKFSPYEIQKSRSRYNVASIDDWGQDDKPQGIRISKANYVKFLGKVNEMDTTLKGIDLDDTNMQELNHVLELTIKQGVTTQMKKDDELMIQGAFIKFSDIIGEYDELDPGLSNDRTVKVLTIHATDTLFIDRDFYGGNMQVNVVAPKWEIVGERTVNLDGMSGAVQEQADTGAEAGMNGKDGKPGLPGCPGGNFMGVYSEVTGIKNLKITSKGGDGGRGQQGGNGRNGPNGADAKSTSDFESKVVSGEGTRYYGEFKYLFYGKDGGKGGNGGNGGVGGIGAEPGTIKVLKTNGDIASLATETNRGSDGAGGAEGSGGEGGKRGNDLNRTKIKAISGERWKDDARTVYRSERAAAGDKGKPNVNSVERKEPENPKNLASIGDILNDFEFYLRENVHDSFLKGNLKKFLQNLKGFYDTKSLTNNLAHLESQLVKLEKTLTNDEIISLYESIMKRTTEYSKNLRQSEDTDEYRKAINYVYTAGLCAIKFRKASPAPNLIVNIPKYLDFVLKNINTLKDLTKKANKVQVANKYKEEFKSNVDKKIAEAEKFIENEILPEIHTVNTQLDEQIEHLVREVIKLKESAKDEREKLLQEKTDLENALWIKVLFGSLKITGSLITKIGPLGVFANSLLNVVIAIDGPKLAGGGKTELPKGVTAQMVKLKEKIAETKKEMKKSELDDLKAKYVDPKMQTEVDAAIASADNKIKKLEEYEKNIRDKMIPFLDETEQMLDDVSKQLETKSQVALDVTKWKVQSTLRDIKLQMKQMTKGFQVEDNIARCVEKLEDAMTTQINIYDRIQNYQEQQILANYIADISTDEHDTNQDLTQTLRMLEVMIRSNLVLEQHKEAVNALNQHVFPFAYLYSKDSSSLFAQLNEEGLENLVKSAAEQLDYIKSKLDEYKSSINKNDRYITNADFNSDYVSVQPFYVWPYRIYAKSITDLLAGKKIILYSDVRRANTKKYAVKFSLSELNFKTFNQAELNEKLKRFEISMTHQGASYYRFKDGIYVIHCKSQTIQYALEKNSAGKPTVSNAVYDKIKNGDVVLSPFAMWEIQLVPLNGGTVDYFKELKKFGDQVDLELVGHGNYVTPDLDVDELHVDKYYEVDITMMANE